MAGPEGPLREAVDAALQTDKQLDARDKEQAIVAQNIRMIKGLWNPKDPETAETNINRAAVLRSMLEVAVSFGIDHQDIADWIYGKGQVGVESHLKELYSDPPDYSQVSPRRGGKILFHDNMPVLGGSVIGGDPGMMIRVEGGSKVYKILDIRVTPEDNLHVEIYKFPNGRFGVIMYDLKERGYAVHRIPTPQFDTFDEAHEDVLRQIAGLREKKGYKVTDLERGKGGRGGGGRGTLPDRGPLDVYPDPLARDKEPEDVELDFSELIKKLKTTRDFKWALGQLEISRTGDLAYGVRMQLIDAVIENKNIIWNNENLLGLFDCILRSTEGNERLNIVIHKSKNPKEFIRYLVWNLQFIHFGDVLTAIGIDRLADALEGRDKKIFIKQFKSFRLSNPERFPGYRRKDHPANSVFA